LKNVPVEDLLKQRYEKFRRMGVFLTPESSGGTNGFVDPAE
jgi:hypothetical protein